MKIAQLTDIHLDDFLNDSYGVDVRANLQRVIRDIKEKGIKQVVITGDLGEVDSFDGIAALMDGAGLDCTYLMGNHDDPRKYCGKPAFAGLCRNEGIYYSRTLQGDLCIYMDSHDNKVGAEQKYWLKNQLAENTNPRIILFMHHPVLDCGDTLLDRKYPLKEREDIEEILAAAKVPVYIFCGHYHGSHEIHRGQLHQFVTSSVLVQLKQQADEIGEAGREFGYRAITIEPGCITSDMILLSPEIPWKTTIPTPPKD